MAKLYFKVASDWEEVVRLRNEIAKLDAQIRSMDANKAPHAVAVLNNQLNASQQQLRGMVNEAAKTAVLMDGDFKTKIYQGSQAVNNFTQKIIDQKAVVKDVEADLRRLTDAYRSVRSNPLRAGNALGELNAAKKALNEEKAALFGLQNEQSNARLSVKKLRDEYALYNTEVKDTTSSTFSLGKAFGIIGGAAVLKQLGSEIINVRSQFRSMEISLETMIGADKANKLLAEIKQYAAISPLELKDVSSATEMMIGFNIEAEKTPRFIQAIGDISRGESQKFQSLSLAFSQMSAAGKLMGQDLNQMINAGFNPLQYISEKTGKSMAQLKDEMSKGAISAEMVQQAFIDVTSAGGKFYNMSQKQSEELSGQISILSDTINNKLNEIGESSEGLIMSGVKTATALVENYETIGKVLTGLIATYGVARVALILHTETTKGYTLAQVLAINTTIAWEKAQKALNLAILKNPYVAVAVVIGGLATAMWALTNSTSAAEKAQERLNNATSKIEGSVSAEMSKLHQLEKKLAETTKGTDEWKSIKESIVKDYGKYLSRIDEEIEKTGSLAGRYDELTASIRKAAAARGFDSVMETEEQEYSKVRNANLEKAYNSFISRYGQEDGLTVYRKWLKYLDSGEKVPEEAQAIFSQTSVGWRKTANSMLFEIREQENAMNGVREKYKNIFGITDEDIKEVKEPELKNDNTGKTYKQDFEAAKKEWNDAKKVLSEIENDKAKFTSKQYEEAKSNYEKTEKAYKDLGGITGSSLTKEENEAEKLRKETEKYKLLLDKQKLEEIRAMEDLQMQADEAYAKTLDEGSDKVIEQMELNFEKEMQVIDRQKEDKLRKKIDAARESFEADPSNKGKTFDASGIILSDAENHFFDKLYKASVESFNKAQKELKQAQTNSWNEYYKEFGTQLKKRQAIQDLYDEKIAKTEGAEKASLIKEKQNELDKFDLTVKNSASLMAQLFADSSQKSVNEMQKIIDKAELLMDYLASVKDEQGTATIDGKTVTKKDILNLGISENTLENLELSTEQVEALRNGIKNLKGELGSKSPFKLFASQVEDAVKAMKNKGDADGLAKGIMGIGNAIVEFLPAVSQFGQDLGNILGSDDLGNKIAGVTDAIGGLGQTAAGVGQIMSGDIVGGAMSAVSGISKVVDSLDGLFGADYSRYNEMKAQYDTLNTIWNELIDKKKEYINTSYGAEANKVGKEALELAEKSIESYRILGRERLNAGSSAGSSSIGKRMVKSTTEADWQDIAKAIDMSVGAAKDFIGTGRMTGLFDLTAEQLEKLKEEAPTFWGRMDDDVREYLNSIIEGEERINDIQDQVREQLTATTFDNVYDNFLNTLMDMKYSAKDAAEDVGEYFFKAMLSNQIGNEYRERLQKWYEEFASYNKDGNLDADEMGVLQEKYQDMIKSALAERDALAAVTGYGRDSASQSSSSKGFQSMSQDTGDELNGRFTALQIAGEDIKLQSIEQTSLLSSINEKMYLKDIANENLPILTLPNIPNIADQTRESIINNYQQSQVNVIFPETKIDVLTVEVSILRGIVDDMRTLQAEVILETRGIGEGMKILSKNSPKMLVNSDGIKQIVQNGLRK